MLGKKYVPIVIIIMLVIALGFTSSAAFAYWQDVSQIGNVVIRFEGEDANLVVEAQHEEFTGKLVPQGYIYFEGEVDEVIFEYDVSVDKTLVQSMNLIVEAKDILIGESDEYDHLVDISIGNAKEYFVNELFNSVVTVTIVVRLLEPIDNDEAVEKGLDLELVNVEDSELAYNSIKGKDISFTISFRVEPKEVE
ncbi:MAG: hypothetical protein NUK62_04765 [Tenericutes bacterium]|nr:hypothetical protein [Mycoplasmatota bacterium]